MRGKRGSVSGFLLYSPLNQGLKLLNTYTEHLLHYPVFTLQSIKSRIETNIGILMLPIYKRFLLYSPLNQGLKLYQFFFHLRLNVLFLLYSPLNQGLKPVL